MTEQDQYKLQLAGFRMKAFDIAINIAATTGDSYDAVEIFDLYRDVILELDLPNWV